MRADGERKAGGRRILKIAAGVLAGLTGLLAVLLALLHLAPVRRAVLERVAGMLETRLGAEIEIGASSWNLFAGRLVLADLVVAPAGAGAEAGPRPRFELARLEADLGLAALLAGRIVVEEARLSGPGLRLVTGPSGKLELPVEPAVAPGPAAAPARLPDVTVEDLSLEDGWFELAGAGPHVRLEGIQAGGRARLPELASQGHLEVASAVVERAGQRAELDSLRASWDLAGDGTGRVELASGGDLQLAASAVLAGLPQAPTYDGRLTAEANLAALGGLLPDASGSAGRVRIEARGRGPFDDLPLDARLQIDGTDLAVLGWNIGSLTAGADLAGGRLESSRIDLAVAGGRIVLQASGRLAPEPEGLQVDGSLAEIELLAALAPLATPVEVAGRLSGSFQATVDGFALAQIAAVAELRVEQPGGGGAAVEKAGESLRLTPELVVRARLQDGLLQLSELRLDEPQAQLVASGQFRPESREFKFDLNLRASALAAYFELAGLEGGGEADLTLAGSGRLPPDGPPRLEATGRLSARNLDLAGYQARKLAFELAADGRRIEIRDGRFEGLGLAASFHGQGRLAGEGEPAGFELSIPEWNQAGQPLPALTAAGTFGPPLRLTVRAAAGALAAEAVVPAGRPITAEGRLDGFPLAAARLLMPAPLRDLEGRLSGSFSLAWPRPPNDPARRARVEITVLNASAAGRSLRATGPARIELRGDRLEIETFEVVAGDGSRVAASGTVDLTAGRLDLDLTAELPAIGPWVELVRPLPVAGSLSADLRIAGTTSAPVLDGTAALRGARYQELAVDAVEARFVPAAGGSVQAVLDVKGLRYQERAIPDSRIEARLAEGGLTAAAELLGSQVSATAEIPDLDSPVVQADVRLDGLELGRLARLAGLPEDLDGLASGRLLVRGPLGEPGRLTADLALETLQLRRGELQVSAEQPIELALSEGRLRIESLRLAGDGLRLRAEGTLEVPGLAAGEHPQAELEIRGDLALGPLAGLMPGLAAAGGRADLQLAIRGSLAKPAITGRILLEEGSAELDEVPLSVERASGRIDLEGERVVVQSLSARVGDGQVQIAGSVGLEGLQPGRFALELSARNVEIPYPEDARFVLGGDLKLAGRLPEPTLSGTIRIEEGIYQPQVDFLALLTSAFVPRRPPAAVRPGEGPETAVALDLTVVAPGDLMVRNPSIDVELGAQLQVTGTTAAPIVLGRVSGRRGHLNFLGSEFEFRKLQLNFESREAIDPTLDIVAVSRPDSEITLRVSGRASNPIVDLSSATGLSDYDVARLLVGRTGGGDGGGPELFQLLGQYASQNLASALADALSLRTGLTITPFPISSQGRAFLFGVSKRLSPDLSVTFYKSGDGDLEDQVELQYQLTPNLSLTAADNSDGSVSGGFRYRGEFH